jgi:hypothetical protein
MFDSFKFVNEDNLDFDDVANKPATQEFEIPINREVGEYQLRYVRVRNNLQYDMVIQAS